MFIATPSGIGGQRPRRVPCIAVLSGGVGRGELEKAGAAAVFDDVQELLDNLDGSPSPPCSEWGFALSTAG